MRRGAAHLLQRSRHWAVPSTDCSAIGPVHTLAYLLKQEQHSSARAPKGAFSRPFSALPEYAADMQHESEASEHSRRLREMQQAKSSRSASLPSSEEVKERLESHSTASCSSSPSPAQQAEDAPSLDWREVVYQLRQSRQPADQITDQMLTDTFG